MLVETTQELLEGIKSSSRGSKYVTRGVDHGVEQILESLSNGFEHETHHDDLH